MDASNFAVQLDLVASGLIRTIEDQLLQGEMEKMRIRAELYTLNVYGNRCSWCPPYVVTLTLLR